MITQPRNLTVAGLVLKLLITSSTKVILEGVLTNDSNELVCTVISVSTVSDCIVADSQKQPVSAYFQLLSDVLPTIIYGE